MTGGTPDGPTALDGRALGDAVLAREPGALERALALATSADPDERASARAAVDAWARRTGKSLRVALVGTPSDAAGALVRHLAARGHRVAVLRVGAAGEVDPEDAFAAGLPADGRGAADAILACEIGGHDTLLIALGAGSEVPLDAVSDCRVGDDVRADVPADLAGADEAALDAAWTAVRRWHWDAVESGEFAHRREVQRRLRDADAGPTGP